MKARLRGAQCSRAWSWREGARIPALGCLTCWGSGLYSRPFCTPSWPDGFGAAAVCLCRRQKLGLTVGLGALPVPPGCQGYSITRRNGDSGNSSAPRNLHHGRIPASEHQVGLQAGGGLRLDQRRALTTAGRPLTRVGKDAALGVRDAAWGGGPPQTSLCFWTGLSTSLTTASPHCSVGGINESPCGRAPN